MKRLMVVILLVSVGLNAGLIWRLSQTSDPTGSRDRTERTNRGHALRDSTKWRGFMERRLDEMRRELDLDEAQVTALRDLHEGTRGLGRRFRAIETGRREVFQAIAAGEFEPDSIRTAMAALSGRQASIDSLIAEKMLQEMAILTPEQRPRYLRMLPRDRFGSPGGGGPRHTGENDGPGPRHGRPDGG